MMRKSRILEYMIVFVYDYAIVQTVILVYHYTQITAIVYSILSNECHKAQAIAFLTSNACNFENIINMLKLLSNSVHTYIYIYECLK